MLLKIFLCLLMTLPVFASELKVSGRRISYRLNWDKEGVRYEAPNARLDVLRKECNSQVIDRFQANMTKVLKASVGKSSTPNMEFTLNGKTHQIHEKSRWGRLLSKLPQEIRRMKIEESLACIK